MSCNLNKNCEERDRQVWINFFGDSWVFFAHSDVDPPMPFLPLVMMLMLLSSAMLILIHLNLNWRGCGFPFDDCHRTLAPPTAKTEKAAPAAAHVQVRRDGRAACRQERNVDNLVCYTDRRILLFIQPGGIPFIKQRQSQLLFCYKINDAICYISCLIAICFPVMQCHHLLSNSKSS